MFEDAAEMAELSGHQRKLALSYSMRGRAARATDDIGIRLDPQGRAYSYAEVKAAYEARFITPGELRSPELGSLTASRRKEKMNWTGTSGVALCTSVLTLPWTLRPPQSLSSSSPRASSGEFWAISFRMALQLHIPTH